MSTLLVCRLCLFKGNEKQVISIFNNEIKDLATKILNYTCINVNEEDTLPKSVCVSCIHRITQWESFYDTCQKSNEILLETEKVKQISEIDEYLDLKQNDKDDSDCSNEFYDMDLVDYDFKEELCNYTYKCEICLNTYNTLFEYLDHQKEHNGKPVFRCDKCSDVFDTRQSLVEHDSNHKIPCDRCGKLILRQSMRLHRVIHTDKFKCQQCNVHCSSQGTLTQHIITVHTDIKNHICDTCGKCFASQSSLRVHIRTHSEKRSYPCKLCNYAGRTASAIYIHMATHSNDTCVCEVCSKSFKSTRNLKDHLRRVHSKVKNHTCVHCERTFVDKYMLKVHLRSHTGLRPYKCLVCSKAFLRSDGLKEHMGTHGMRTLCDCKGCGKKFASKRGLNRHNCTALL